MRVRNVSFSLVTVTINVWYVCLMNSRWNARSTIRRNVLVLNDIAIISGRFVGLAFPYLIFSKASVYSRLISPHCLRLTTTVSFSPRDHLSPPSFYSQYSMKSGDTEFVYWVSSKSAFLTLYISQLSFLRSTSLPPPPLFFISYLQTMLVSISIHCARHAERKTSLLKSCAATTQVI